MNTKKIFATMLLGMAIVAGAQAQEESGEKLVVLQPNKVIVDKTADAVEITIEGEKDNPDYRYNTRFNLEGKYSENTSMTQNGRDWDLSLPFGIGGKKKNAMDGRAIVKASGFGVGLVSGLNTPEGLSVNMGESWEFQWDIFDVVEAHSANQRWLYGIGFGLNWKNYRMTGNNRFFETGNNITIGAYPEGASPKFSRIKVFSLTVPFNIGYAIDRHFTIDFAPIVNFNTHASMKTRYTLDGEKFKEKTNDVHQQKVTVDFRATLAYDDIGIYVKYSPCNVLKSDFAPKFSGISTGIVLVY